MGCFLVMSLGYIKTLSKVCLFVCFFRLNASNLPIHYKVDYLPCLHLLRRPIDHLHCAACIFRRTLELVMVFKVPRLLATIVITILNPVTTPLPDSPKRNLHIEQVASHLKPPSPFLTLELKPLAHLFIFTSSYFPSVHLLHSIVATQAM